MEALNKILSLRTGELSKDKLIEIIRLAKCKRLEGLPLEHMDLNDIVEHLRHSCCPIIQKLFSQDK